MRDVRKLFGGVLAALVVLCAVTAPPALAGAAPQSAELWGGQSYNIGFSTYTGTVTAADNWDEPAETKRVNPGMTGSYEALFHDVGKVETLSRDTGKVSFHQHEFASARLFRQAMKRARFLEPEVERNVHFLVGHLGLVEAYSAAWTDSAVRRLMKDLGEHFERTLMLARADITTKHAHKREKYHQAIHDLAERAKSIAAQDAIVPPLPKGLGDALMAAFGIPPSKRLGDLKAALEKAAEAGRVESHQDSAHYVSFLSKHRDEFGL